jgi:4-hydroxybenzoyl-CoA reductase subunit beta
MPEFEYKRPKTVNELFDLLSGNKGTIQILAGGTDLMPRLKNRLQQIDIIIDIKDIDGLNYIKDEGENVRIGALATIYQIKTNAHIKEIYPALNKAAILTANENLQQRGTLGGNILQDTRCLYYNKPEVWRNTFKPCFKSDGNICNAAKGAKRCLSVYRGDLAPALISLGASICLVSKGYERIIPLEDIFTGDGKAPFSLGKSEFVKDVIIPSTKRNGGYEKFRMRKSVDYPIVNIALSIDTEDNGRLVVGSSGAMPLIYEFGSLEELRQVPERAYNDISPINNMALAPLYRKRMVRVLSEKLIGFS